MTPEVTYWRQRDILSPQQMEGVSVTLIGAGGIGSPTALCLAKMGISRMTVYDHDRIEEHNFPNQMYPQRWIYYNDTMKEVPSDSIGTEKVYALRGLVQQFSGWEPQVRPYHYTDQPLEGIVISAVDSMSARKDIWYGVREYRTHIKLYIEARMGAEIGMVYTVDPNDLPNADWYELHMLYPDSESLPIPCTATTIIYNTMMMAALIGRQVKNYLTAGHLPREICMDINNLSLMRSEQR